MFHVFMCGDLAFISHVRFSLSTALCIGFCRCTRGPDSGAYHHPFFLRGKQPLAKNIVRTKIKGCGHKTMKLHEAEPDFHSMAPILEAGQGVDGPSVASSSAGQSIVTQPPAEGCISPDPTSPSPSIASQESIITARDGFPSSIMMAEHQLSRQSSLTSSLTSDGSAMSPSDFVNDLNSSIFIHELARVCTTLCNLRKDTNL